MKALPLIPNVAALDAVSTVSLGPVHPLFTAPTRARQESLHQAQLQLMQLLQAEQNRRLLVRAPAAGATITPTPCAAAALRAASASAATLAHGPCSSDLCDKGALGVAAISQQDVGMRRGLSSGTWGQQLQHQLKSTGEDAAGSWESSGSQRAHGGFGDASIEQQLAFGRGGSGSADRGSPSLDRELLRARLQVRSAGDCGLGGPLLRRSDSSFGQSGDVRALGTLGEYGRWDSASEWAAAVAAAIEGGKGLGVAAPADEPVALHRGSTMSWPPSALLPSGAAAPHPTAALQSRSPLGSGASQATAAPPGMVMPCGRLPSAPDAADAGPSQRERQRLIGRGGGGRSSAEFPAGALHPSRPLPPAGSYLTPHLQLSTAAPPRQPKCNNALYKTEPCRSWQASGSCRYGPKCQFAHGSEELRAVPTSVGKPCHMFAFSGACPFGDSCRFQHSGEGGPSDA